MKAFSLTRRVALIALVLFVSGQACALSLLNIPNFPASSTSTPAVVAPPSTPQPAAQTTFIASIPEPLQAGETLVLAVLDEVTGLSLNATYYPMSQSDGLTYSASLPLPLNSVVKYRYARRSASQTAEDTSLNGAVRYRMAYITGPGEVRDIVADWADKSYARPTGRIQGRVTNADTGSAVPNVLVSAGGVQFITDSTGRFDLNGLPVGTHNLIAYSLDGMYSAFQQGAVIGDGQTTTVDLPLKPASLVNVTFMVSIPANTQAGAPVRVAGNLLQLGNTFADLQGGFSMNAERMPTMTLQSDGRYAVTMRLPVGAYIQYKYTLGDGFWNAEHNPGGGFVLREFVVLAQDMVLQDTVSTWQSGASAPIIFDVTVPPHTPAGDIIYIQFNPYGWTEPIPMWPFGNNRWVYKLYSPLNMLGAFTYRYCRNAQCGSADDFATSGNAAHGREVSTALMEQDIVETVQAWNWYDNPDPTALVGTTINVRSPGFVAGIEYQATHHPSWSYFMPQAFANTQALGATHVILTPSWTYTNIKPLIFAPQPGSDPLWNDSAVMIGQAKALGLNVILFPTPHFPLSAGAASPSADFWMTAPRDAAWWATWFSRYRAFAINYADLASQTGAQALILGGDWVMPALPNGVLPDGSPSNVPADAEAQWKALFAETRQHFAGKIYWALPYTKSALPTSLSVLQDSDGIYLLWSASLSTNPSATKMDYAAEAGRLLDNEVSPLQALINKPVILAIAYPSALGSASGCLADGKGGCLDWAALSRPNADVGALGIDLQAQADIYEGFLNAVNARAWIAGFVSRGFYPPAFLQDKSASVHGKPAADILWYWFPRMTGIVK